MSRVRHVLIVGEIPAALAPRVSSGPTIIFSNGYEGCSLAAWTNTGAGGGPFGNPRAGKPSDSPPVKRYAGNCAMEADSNPEYVRDVSPAAESFYRARLYVFPSIDTGEVTVFRAARAAGETVFTLGYDATTGAFVVRTDDGAGGLTVTAQQNRWYSVEFSFSNGSPRELRFTIQGAGMSVPLANNLTISSGLQASDVVDQADLGWVATRAGAPTGSITVDAFESARFAAIGRLCRGDGNADSALDIRDSVAVGREFGSTGIPAPGQPDCNEDGAVNNSDRDCVRNRILNEETCP